MDERGISPSRVSSRRDLVRGVADGCERIAPDRHPRAVQSESLAAVDHPLVNSVGKTPSRRVARERKTSGRYEDFRCLGRLSVFLTDPRVDGTTIGGTEAASLKVAMLAFVHRRAIRRWPTPRQSRRSPCASA